MNYGNSTRTTNTVTSRQQVPRKKIENSMKLPWITNNKRLLRKCKTTNKLRDKYENKKDNFEQLTYVKHIGSTLKT